MSNLQEILTTAESLFLKYGIKRVSMDDLASEMGISKKTLYLHIENKRELTHKVVSNYITREQDLVKYINANSANALDEMWTIAQHIRIMLRNMADSFVFDLKKYYRKTWQLYENGHLHFIRNNVKDNLKRGVEEGLYREEINPEVISRIYMTKMHVFSDESLFPPMEYPREKLFMDFFEYHIYGIASPKGLIKLQELKKNEK